MRITIFLLMMFVMAPAAVHACGCGSSKCSAPAAPSAGAACNGCGMPNCALPSPVSPGTPANPPQAF